MGKGGEAVADEPVVEWLVPVGAEHGGEVGGLDPAEHEVGVGDGERAAAPVAGGTGYGTGGVRSHAVAGAVEVEDRAAPAATVWMSSMGARSRTPAIRVVKTRSYSPAKCETSVEVPPMSKPITRS
ncbi:hypothetical protein SHKM778_61560 [Streptomyces sp. KM77-8]|uniref:Uncharacterized protein n=1 Tax=Streptomyces haneummycinicus TaxID=3074435 RepID=A0AAT9HR37_9ACTN